MDILMKPDQKMSKECKDEDRISEKRMLEFFAGISHEIRNSLNGIIGISHLIGSTPSDLDRQKYVQILIKSSEGLLGLVNNIMELGKYEVTEAQLNLQPTDVRKSLVENLLSQQLSAEEKGLQFSIEIEEEVPQVVLVDEGRLNQVLLNLVSNAIKFTEDGSVSVVLGIQRINAVEAWLKFTVSDTGIGIPGEKLNCIFDPFNQGQEDTSLNYGGTGLGLSISKKIIDIMGGELKVSSKLGSGSQFHFDFVIENRKTEDNNGIEEKFRSSGEQKKKKILIVEDNNLNVLVVKNNLKNWGFQCEVSNNGLNAVRKVQEQHFDLVLMDFHMPEMNGLEAVQVIRNLSGEEYKQLPIIALSASSRRELKEMEASGVIDILSKPFKSEDLYHKIMTHLELDIAQPADCF